MKACGCHPAVSGKRPDATAAALKLVDTVGLGTQCQLRKPHLVPFASVPAKPFQVPTVARRGVTSSSRVQFNALEAAVQCCVGGIRPSYSLVPCSRKRGLASDASRTSVPSIQSASCEAGVSGGMSQQLEPMLELREVGLMAIANGYRPKLTVLACVQASRRLIGGPGAQKTSDAAAHLGSLVCQEGLPAKLCS